MKKGEELRLWLFPSLQQVTEPIEKVYWLALLNLPTMNMDRAAGLSGVSRRQINYRLAQLHIGYNKATHQYEPEFPAEE